MQKIKKEGDIDISEIIFKGELFSSNFDFVVLETPTKIYNFSNSSSTNIS